MKTMPPYIVPRYVYLLIFIILTVNRPVTSIAEDVLQQIEETGVIRIGFQEDVAPFSSFDKKNGVHRGFSIDMAEELVFYLSKRFGKKIRLKSVNLQADQRASSISSGKIDIEMGASTQTYDRERQVDFSLVYFASETTFLVNRASSIEDILDLGNKRISAAKGTSNLELLEQLTASGQLLSGEIFSFDNHHQALLALASGKVDAYCADRVLLTTKRLQTKDPERWSIMDDSIGYDPYAFMIPENNSEFRDFVNNTIRWSILTGRYFDIYEKWMGPLGVGPFKMSPGFKEYLNAITYPLPESWWEK